MNFFGILSCGMELEAGKFFTQKEHSRVRYGEGESIHA